MNQLNVKEAKELLVCILVSKTLSVLKSEETCSTLGVNDNFTLSRSSVSLLDKGERVESASTVPQHGTR